MADADIHFKLKQQNNGRHCNVTEEKEAEYNNEDFSFSRAFHGINTRIIQSDDVFYFKPVFPYFNQRIVMADGGEDTSSLKGKDVFDNVNKVFVKMPHYVNDLLSASMSSRNVEIVKPCFEWDNNNHTDEVAPQRFKKCSISTRLSKIFKLERFLRRNKNDSSRDVIVFVKTSAVGRKGQEKVTGIGKKMKEPQERKLEGNEFKAKKVVNRKNSVFLAQQNYMRNRAMEEDRRTAYLSHRAVAFGFSTKF